MREPPLPWVKWGAVDIDEIQRPIIAAGLNHLADRTELPEHRHRKHELIYTVKGVLTCEIDQSLWTVSPHSAIWIPAGVPHRCQAFGKTGYFVVFIDPDIGQDLPQLCCTMSVSGLLREAIVRAADYLTFYPLDGPEMRLLPVILDELAAARTADHRLPLPSDPGLRRLLDMMMAAPDDKASFGQWAARCALSERTLSRKMQQETGMSLWRWRHQLHVALALQRMAAGDTVQAAALDLGYETASSFITMFKKAVGKPPARFLTERGSETADS